MTKAADEGIIIEKKQEEDMSCVEAVEQMAKAVLGNSDKVISTDEYNVCRSKRRGEKNTLFSVDTI